MHIFGIRSFKKLATCHKDLQLIMKESLMVSRVDFGISEGHRTVERQHQLFLEGKSKIDGIDRKGKHNMSPSHAVDIYAYHPNIEMRRKMAYDKITLAYIAGVVITTAMRLFEEGKIDYTIRWGANWDLDGVIHFDQSFDDYPHFELRKMLKEHE